ncbi:hypothetical protein IHE45_15G057900 [Dioscorea alata]|uniref:Uncharacterized protein n=1 Tax=Dioscorea alata TaxID=55571 RepID=A0ACB7ULQ7_DIOAL|nr:hypothetical protein IHE45_15G057900 [Dioscorea alata]
MVPEDIRLCDMKAYDPLVVTIGPYHYNKFKESRTPQAMQDHKWHCVWRLLSKRTKSKPDEFNDLFSTCLKILKLKDDFVRDCYSENLQRLKDDDLALIMLLDGCFIIHVLLTFNGNLHPGDIYKEDDIAAGHEIDMEALKARAEVINIDLRVDQRSKVWDTMLLDLVKVENQMPFQIIEMLFDELKTPGDEDIDLVNIADKLLSPLHPSYPSFTKVCFLTNSYNVRHLLDLFHSTLVPSDDYLRINKIKLTEHRLNHRMNSEIIWVPSATELQLTGVKFAEKKGRAISFLDISFTNGTIEIPKVRLHGATSTLFKNLIAFEQCDYLGIEDNYVTAYAFFMDYMINASKDVELFELEGIFHNQLGTPDHAATLINQLCLQIRDRGDSYLQCSMNEVKIYYDSKWNKWWAGLIHDHFQNPWTIASLVAAVILLLLTVEQSFFAAYSYFRPPS